MMGVGVRGGGGGGVGGVLVLDNNVRGDGGRDGSVLV